MKLGFLGSGKMATALAGGVLKAGAFPPEEIAVTDCAPAAAKALAEKFQLRSVATNAELVSWADTIILCVKPGDALPALRALRNELGGKLLISIAAGLTLASLQESAGPGVRVIRVMPNTPALIHKGAAAHALGKTARNADGEPAEKIFSAVGNVFRVKEELLDAVTGLSGSGPAYVYIIVEALSDAGVLMGLPRDLSLQLAARTVAGAGEMVLQTGLHPAVLKDMVTSPGGTTIAGIEALERAGIRSALLGAVRAATLRAREMNAEAASK